MTKLEKQCKDMADVCELAHNRTVRDCRKLKIKVDKVLKEEDEVVYTTKAQRIFNSHYDKIINATNL